MLKIYCVLSYLSESYLSYNIRDRTNVKSILSETKPLVKKLLSTHFDFSVYYTIQYFQSYSIYYLYT